MKKVYIAFELLSFILMGAGIGWFVDQFWPSSGIAVAVGIVLGFLLWSFYIWKKLRS